MTIDGDDRFADIRAGFVPAQYIVLWFDLLAVKSQVLSGLDANQIVTPEKQKTIDQYSAAIYSFVCNVREMYRLITQDAGSVYDRIFAGQRVDGCSREVFIRECSNLKLGVQQFSDTTVLYVKDTGEFARIVVQQWMQELSFYILDALKHGVTMRGCFAYGIGWTIGENCLFGPVVEECYRLEQHKVGYPRILQTESFQRLCKDTESHISAMSPRCGTAFSAQYFDYDGLVAFDYLHPMFLALNGIKQAELRELYDSIVRDYDNACDRHESTVAEKYFHLKEYFCFSCDRMKKGGLANGNQMP